MNRIEPGHLSRATSVVQALDNQWVPRELLKKLLDNGTPRQDYAGEITELMRQEYLRALLNSRNVVINRAYLINSNAINRDFLDEKQRDQFGMLLIQKAIVPYLFRETQPDEEPGFEFDKGAFEEWRSVLKHFEFSCARLSWSSDERNRDLAHNLLARRFHDFTTTLHSCDVPRLAQRLGVVDEETNQESKSTRDERIKLFKKQLQKLRNEANDFYDDKDRYVDRNHLYQKFVCADGKDAVVRGHYDGAKPFAGPIKELLDLKYTLNLPDALQCCSLTAQDSLPRTVLPLEHQTIRLPEVNTEKLVDQIRAIRTFEILNEQLWQLNLKHLELGDIVVIRSLNEWNLYILAVEDLLANPHLLDDPNRGVRKIVECYGKLTPLIRDRLGRRSAQVFFEKGMFATESATLGLMFAIPVVGHLLHVAIHGSKLIAKIFPKRIKMLENRAEKLVGSFLIGGEWTKTESEAEMSQQWLEGKISSAKDAIESMIADLQKAGAEIVDAEKTHDDIASVASDNSLPDEA